MPRRNNKSKRSRRNNRLPSGTGNPMTRRIASTCRVPFNVIRTFSLAAATTASAPVTPAFDALLQNISFNFEFYRFVSLNFKMLPSSQTVDFTYYPSNESSSVADTFLTISLAALNRVLTPAMSVPVSLNVPRNTLYESPESWWSCATGANDYQQGRFVLATPATVTATFVVQAMGVIEFKMPSANSSDLNHIIPNTVYSNVHYPACDPPKVKEVFLQPSVKNESVVSVDSSDERPIHLGCSSVGKNSSSCNCHDKGLINLRSRDGSK